MQPMPEKWAAADGTVLTMSENGGMLALGRKLGFRLAKDPTSARITNLTMDLAAWLPA